MSTNRTTHMTFQKTTLRKTATALLALAAAGSPFTLQAQDRAGAVPGSVNFVQGQATLNGENLGEGAAINGTARQLRPGETLATAHGSADVLLAPGTLLRVGENASVQMLDADPHRTEVRLERGLANISVHKVPKDELLLIDTPGGQTQLLSAGLYSFNAASNTIRVFNGEAWAFPGRDTQANVKPVKIKEGHELALGDEKPHPESFDRSSMDADLLPWTGPVESRGLVADSGLSFENDTTYGDGASAGLYPALGSGFYGAYGYGLGPYGFGDPFYAGLGGGFGYGYGFGPFGFAGSPFFGGYGGYGGYGFYGGGFYQPYGFIGGLRGNRIPHGFAGQGGGFQGGHIPHGFNANNGFHGGQSAGGFHGGSNGGFHGGSSGGFHGGGGGHR